MDEPIFPNKYPSNSLLVKYIKDDFDNEKNNKNLNKNNNNIYETYNEEYIHNIDSKSNLDDIKIDKLNKNKETSNNFSEYNSEKESSIFTKDNTKFYLKEISKLAFPSVFSSLIVYSLETINLIFASKIIINDKNITNIELIEGIGSGNIFMNFFGYLFGLGMINSLETLCSQEFGRKDLKQLSKWGKICFYFMTFYFIILTFISLNSNFIISQLLRQNERISFIAANYIYSFIPSFLLQYYFNIYTKILNSQQIYQPVLLINFFILLFHPVWCWIFFSKFKFYYWGLGIASTVTALLILVSLHLYCNYYKFYLRVSFKEIEKKDYIYFIKIALESGVLCSTDILGFEIVSIISSYLPDSERTANINLINIYNNIYSISIGFATTLTTLVGNYIGEENIKIAEFVGKIGTLLNLSLTLFISFFCIFFNTQIALFYLDDKIVLELTSQLIRIAGFFIIFDALQLQLTGIIRGLGKQFEGMIIGLIVFMGIQSFLTYLFAYPLKLGVIGIWISLILSTCLGATVFFCYLKIIFKKLKNNEKINDNKHDLFVKSRDCNENKHYDKDRNCKDNINNNKNSEKTNEFPRSSINIIEES